LALAFEPKSLVLFAKMVIMLCLHMKNKLFDRRAKIGGVKIEKQKLISDI
jgi:hypothetical protein